MLGLLLARDGNGGGGIRSLEVMVGGGRTWPWRGTRTESGVVESEPRDGGATHHRAIIYASLRCGGIRSLELGGVLALLRTAHAATGGAYGERASEGTQSFRKRLTGLALVGVLLEVVGSINDGACKEWVS